MNQEFPDFQGPSLEPLLTPKPRSFFSKNRVWLNAVLFAATVVSTVFVGTSWSVSYKYAEAISRNPDLKLGPEVFFDPDIIRLSIIYALVLIGILLGHEMGHFLACRVNRIDATLPYFIPAPTLIGTLGAFIKIRSPITQKQQLFDIGVAGPLTGFILSVPTLAYGLILSKPVPSLPPGGGLVFGEPLLLKIMASFIFKGVPETYDIILHPVAFAGWVGILVTALNLFPIGQLDGGHVFYAMVGEKARRYVRWILAAFVVMGIFFWVGWLVWALLISVLGLKHPRIVDEHTPLSPKRRLLGFVIFVIFILSFIPAPIKGYNIFDLLQSFHI